MEALIPITMFMSIAAVLILRPMTKRIGGLLEALTRDRLESRAQDSGSARTIALLEHINRRLDLIEERVDFTERLISERGPALPRTARRPSLSTPEMEVEYLTR